MEQCELDKITQLVKSDCPNNRLLGFQLAKGLGYDLMELLNNTKVLLNGYGGKVYTIGNHVCNIYQTASNDWTFRIDYSPNKYTIEIHRVNCCVYSHTWVQNCKYISKQFINLIINE